MLKRTLLSCVIIGLYLLAFSTADGQQQPADWLSAGVGIMASSGDSQVIAVRYTDTRIASRIDLFDAATGRFLTSGDLEPFAPLNMDLSPTGDRLLWSDGTGNIGIYDVNAQTNTIVRRGGEGSGVDGVDWSSGSELVGWKDGSEVLIYDVAAARNLASMSSGAGQVGDLAISKTGTQILMSLYRNSLEDIAERDSLSTEIWNVPVESNEFQFLRDPAVRIEGVGGYAVAWSPDGERFAVGEESGFAVYELDNATLTQVSVENIWPYTLAWSPDGSTLATGVEVQFWDTTTWQLVSDQGFSSGYLEWAPDSQHIYHNGGPGGTLAVNEMTLTEWQELQAATPTPLPTSTPTPTPSATPTPAAFQRLRVTAICSDDPATSRRWRIRNPNPYPVPFTWEMHNSPSGQQGTGTAPVAVNGVPSAVILTTPTERWIPVIEVTANGRSDLAINLGIPCAWP